MCKYFDTDDPDVDTGHYTGYYTGRFLCGCYETNNIIKPIKLGISNFKD